MTCKQCIYYAVCMASVKNELCDNFKLDPPDGGYYG